MIDYLLAPYNSYSFIQILMESIAAILGILSVYFATKKNILVYPIGIISTIIYTILLFQWQLFGDMFINLYYTIMSIYGWILWEKNNVSSQILNTRLDKNSFYTLFSIFIGSMILIMIIYIGHYALETHTIGIELLKKLSWINYVDSITTSTFLIAMYLMARKSLFNWHFWILGNSIAIPMFLEKGYAITAFQYLIFLILAIRGLIEWKKEKCF
jgi:nicotinamide mononucleotide transporter